MSASTTAVSARIPVALYALTIGAFGIGTTEFVIMGLLLQVGAALHVSIGAAGMLISGYALGVFVGAPLLTAASARLPRKTVLLGLMAIFTLGNLGCALAPSYGVLMAARIVTSLAHGTFFGVGSVVAAGLVVPERRASAISLMFTGLTLATLLGVPAGTWLGHLAGWRATFWAVAAIGVAALLVIGAMVPADRGRHEAAPLRVELRAVAQPAVLLGLATTVFGFAGVFTVFTYVQPLLTRVSGFADAAVSPILLLVGVGLVLGNLLGGRLADRSLAAALVGSLLALAVVLALTGLALHVRLMAVPAMVLFGIAAFATVAPLQLWVLQKAAGAPNLASSLNIGAFNLGNALGAWLGALVIEHGAGLSVVPYSGALVTLAGAAVALAGLRAARPSPAVVAACGR